MVFSFALLGQRLSWLLLYSVCNQNEHSVIHEDDAGRIERSSGEKFDGRDIRLGVTAGCKDLGCTLFEVLPERNPALYHYHTANRTVYVLDGAGMLTTAAGETKISALAASWVRGRTPSE